MWLEPLGSPALAFVTTVHFGLAVLRNHRSASALPISALALVSGAFAVLPWLMPTPAGLLAGLAFHIAWFVACERLSLRNTVAPPVATRTPAAAPGPPRTAASGPPRISGFVPVPVLAVIEETGDIRTVRLARPQGFDFVAGQFITVRVRVDGKEHSRCYSISSPPSTSGYLEISVKRQGMVSNAIHAAVRPGGTLSVRAPAGAFRYPQGDDRPIVLVAGGIGITPLIAMLRHAVDTEPARPVTLVYSARTDDDFAFADELLVAARRHPQLRVYFAASRGSTSPGTYPGRIDETLLRTTVPDVAHSIVFVCGPTPMIESTRALLARLGVPEAQVRHETFEAAIAAAAEAPERSARPQAGRGEAHRLTCARTGRQIPVHDGQTLLDAAEEAGVALESMCRAGVCGTCRVQVTRGNVTCESDTLASDERHAGFVLACVATAQSDCTVNL